MLLNVALAVLVGLLGWYLKQKWDEGKEQERRVRMATISPPPVPQPPPLRKVSPIDGPSYGEVATRNLFSADRNPTPILDPPPPPPPAPKMPPLPSAHGVMLWEGVPPTVVLSVGNSQQKGYHPGDRIGEFTVVSVDNKEVVFYWNGKPVTKRLDEIMAKNMTPVTDPGPQAAAAPAPAATAPAESLSGPVNGPGKEVPGGIRMCNPGDTSPPGTIAEGFEKKVNTTPFGVTCRWEHVK
jgi:hypothetical protein